ncbi:MAG TPA: hypothetical protein VK606_02125 [Verrucomicrobiae bacterium]|jgi:hypothetical protein|nr:hypothetical protein [Verrucomicrobiae bacterium]
MRSRRTVITVVIVSVAAIVVFFLIWIVMLGPALVILMKPQAS